MAVTATSAVLDVIKWQNLQENAKKTGDYLLERLTKEILPFECVGDVRGLGLFQGIDIVKSKESRLEDSEMAKKIIMKMSQKKKIIIVFTFIN